MQVFDGHRFSFSWAAWGGMKHPVRAENSSSKSRHKTGSGKICPPRFDREFRRETTGVKGGIGIVRRLPPQSRLEARGAEGYAMTNATDNGGVPA
jgi:hypothetical protein